MTLQLTEERKGVRVPVDLECVTDIGLLVAIEVKYAEPDKSDIEKLTEIRNDYLPQIFAYIPATNWDEKALSDWITEIRERS